MSLYYTVSFLGSELIRISCINLRDYANNLLSMKRFGSRTLTLMGL